VLGDLVDAAGLLSAEIVRGNSKYEQAPSRNSIHNPCNPGKCSVQGNDEICSFAGFALVDALIGNNDR
jgi:hypothetical protein